MIILSHYVKNDDKGIEIEYKILTVERKFEWRAYILIGIKADRQQSKINADLL